jgi:hypothetical protein
MSLHHELENILVRVMQSGGIGAGIEPGLADTLLKKPAAQHYNKRNLGYLLYYCARVIRFLLAKFLRRALPQLKYFLIQKFRIHEKSKSLPLLEVINESKALYRFHVKRSITSS